MKKNVLIISVETDASTNSVMDWIYYLGHKVVRLNGDSLFEADYTFSQRLSNDVNETKMEKGSSNFLNGKIDAVWLRRDKHQKIELDHSLLEDEKLYELAFKGLRKEQNKGKKFFFACLIEKSKVLGGQSVGEHEPSKSQMLLQAKLLGIDIPDTLITNKKSELIPFFNTYSKVITKPLSEVTMFQNEEGLKGILYTALVDMDAISDTFFISQFQEALEKEIEIRTFYLDGVFYSMAIFSQLDEQTQTDFRIYNNQVPNRTVPYQLPTDLEEKLDALMKALGIKSGSMDIIKTTSGRYVFLEVNSHGQYGMTSGPCNYYLDEKIAQYLTT